MTDLWRKAIDSGHLTGVVFLDLAKAFDCIDHSILLNKLPYYGVRKSSHAWLCSYLQARQQRVRLSNEFSDWGEITHGVPQGSILGPLLFSLYINDLPSVINKSKTDIFADDTTIHYSSPSASEVENSLQCDMAAVGTWMISNKLKLNHPKTVAMLIGTRQRLNAHKITIVVDDKPIKQVCTKTYLGVKIDNHLSWEHHIDSLVAKARGKLHAIRRMMPL